MSATERDRERARKVISQYTEIPWDLFEDPEWTAVDAIAAALAEERKNALRRAAEQLKFTPLSERESGVLSDYTQGIHAAAQLVTLMTEEGE